MTSIQGVHIFIFNDNEYCNTNTPLVIYFKTFYLFICTLNRKRVPVTPRVLMQKIKQENTSQKYIENAYCASGSDEVKTN